MPIKIRLCYLFIIFIAVLLIECSPEKKHPATPITLQDRIFDNAGVLSATAEVSFFTLIHYVENHFRVRISVMTVATLNGEPIKSFSKKTVEKINLGNAKEKDGIIYSAVWEC